MDKLLDNFFKNCHLQPNFFLLSIKYLQAINNQVSTTSKIAVSDDSNLNIQDTNLKKKLFFSIEKQLSAIQETKFKTIATVEHDKSINEICFSDDNNFFATASNDGTVQIYKFTDDNW
jgi:WD40 repeat protein